MSSYVLCGVLQKLLRENELADKELIKIRKQFEESSTLASKVHIELPIVCMISTAEPTAFFTSWISACSQGDSK
jgi:hypothetical protein